MADQGLSLLDDTPQATPLDLLINAISGSGQYSFTGDDGGGAGGNGNDATGAATGDAMAAYLEGEAASNAHAGPSSGARAVDLSRKRTLDGDDDPHSPRENKIARTLTSHFAASRPNTGISAAQRTFSTIEVWHPKTGQKSYGKERRILQPPPTLRVTGPLAPLLSSVTLSSHPNPDPPQGHITFSTQTHRLGGQQEPVPELYVRATKKAEREERRRRLREAAAKTGWGSTLPWERNRNNVRDRNELTDGIAFPGLWVGEETGKSKEFRLELSIGPPGLDNEVDHTANGLETGETVVPQAETPLASATQPIDEAALRRVLGATGMDPLMSLGEGDVPEPGVHDDGKGLVHHLAAAIDPVLEAESSTAIPPIPPIDEAAAVAVASTPPFVPKPWATFVSDPLTIVSKPSQKTAKARSMASCLSTTDAFALYVRVNAQTVRTKFMKLDDGDTDTPALAARPGKWSPFRFDVLYRAQPPEPEDKGQRTRFKLDLDRENGVITYGSIVQLVEVQSGVRSDPLRLVRVDKNEVVVDADRGHPVSELQRVGLVRVVDGVDDMEGGSRWYLSAPGAVAGAGEVNTTRARPGKQVKTDAEGSAGAVPETLGGLDSIDPALDEATDPKPDLIPEAESSTRPRKKKTKRHALARAAITEEEQGSRAAGLGWHRSRRREVEQTVTEGGVTSTRTATVETVDDWMCWVLTGVWCFSYSFFNGLGDTDPLPKAPIDPVPRLLVDPVFHMDTNSLDLTLSYFFMPDAEGHTLPQPLSVYLGPIGPLRATTWRSQAPKEKYYDPGALYPALPYSEGLDDNNLPIPDGRRVFSNYPNSVPHTIAMVELPPLDEILRVMNEYSSAQAAAVIDAEDPPPPTAPEPAEPGAEDNAWFGVMGSTGELTIQEALRNAGKQHSSEAHHHHDVAAALAGPVEADSTLGKVGDEFGIEQLGDNLIDPALDGPGGDAAAAAVTATDVADGADVTAAAAAVLSDAQASGGGGGGANSIAVHRPDRAGKDSLAALPLLVVRPDGVGHSIGWSVVAARASAAGAGASGAGNGNGNGTAGASGAPWGLRVVQTSARGQSLAW